MPAAMPPLAPPERLLEGDEEEDAADGGPVPVDEELPLDAVPAQWY